LLRAVPDRVHAFLELHSARRRWHRDSFDDDRELLPSLVLYIDLAQHLGHVRLGPPRLLAGFVWWTATGCLSGPFRHDASQQTWCVGALKRMLLTSQALASDQDLDLEGVPVDFDDGAPPGMGAW
jgi:hypothetical protein